MTERAPDPAAPRPQRARRWISLLVGAALVSWLLSRVTLEEIATGMRDAQIEYIIASVLMRFAANVVRTVRYHYFFSIRGQWLRLYGVFALIRAINYVAPFRLGELAALALLKKTGFSPTISETAPTWLLFRLCDAAGLLAIATSALLFTALPSVLERRYMAIIVLIGLTTLALVFLTPFIAARISSSQLLFLRRFPKLSSRVEDFRAGLSRVRSTRRMTIALTSSILTWAANIAGLALALLAFEVSLTSDEVLLASILVVVVGLLPVRPPMGLGVADAIWTGALVLVGTPVTEAIVLAVGVRLVTMLAVLADYSIGSILAPGSSRPEDP